MIAMLAEVRDCLRPTPMGLRGDVGRYQGETAFGIWLAEHLVADSSWCEEETGTAEWRHWIRRVGRRVVTVDNYGFTQVTRFVDVDHACAWFDAERDEYEAWEGF